MTSLDPLLEDKGLKALVVVTRSARDPQMAPFLKGGRVGYALMVAPHKREPRLGYLSPMEREEARRSGLSLLTPQELDVQRFSRQGCLPHELWAGVVGRALHLCELSPGPVALAGSMTAGLTRSMCQILEAEGWSFEPGEAIADLYRKRKTVDEVAAIKRAAAGTMEAFRRVAQILADAEISGEHLISDGSRLTVGDLRCEIARVLAAHGLEQPEGNIVAPAEEGAVAHTVGTDARELRVGESLVVDIFPCGEMFADCTRTFCVGQPSERLAAGHSDVLRALEAAEALASPGASGWSLQQAICDLFGQQGHPTPISQPGTDRGYVHGLGHGVGYEVHELPGFREHLPEAEGKLEVGDVITLEPGLYEPDEKWAVRLEDLYLVTETGLENLTPLPRDLNPRAW